MAERDNPLLEAGELPAFDRIEPKHVAPGMRALLEILENEFLRIEASAAPTWASLVEPLERVGDRLARGWGTVSHLLGVRNSPELREAFESVQAEVVQFGLRMAQSRPIFAALSQLREGAQWRTLDPAQQRIIDVLLRDARLAGVGLEGDARKRLGAVESRLAALGTRFGNNVLDATRAFGMTLRDPADAEGLPESLRELAAQAARAAGDAGATAADGPWRIGLDAPSLVPFLEHSPRRSLREKLYRAHITRASEDGVDNAPVLEEILELRGELAKLIGFRDYVEVSLESKMAPNLAAVEALLEELREVSFEAARRELVELSEIAASGGAAEATGLEPWDVAFWAERLREDRFDYSGEALRPYFPFPVVLAGLFDLSRSLFGVEIEEADGDAPVWHSDVRFFRVRDENGAELAAFYLDAYARPGEKQGGAWMDACCGRSRLLAPEGRALRLPVAYLVCNQQPPVDGRPSCLSFDEVRTLFHEFGHGLQHMLTTVDYGLAAGIQNIEWDAVELPSQFMENWCYEPTILREISEHVETGDRLPSPLIDKVQAARTYRAGSDMLRQLYFAFTDLELYRRPLSGGDSAFDVQRRVAERTTVIAPLAEDRSLCAFGHIFGGGYAAGYYSYKWAEVLSADAFACFEEAGLDDSSSLERVGRRFRDTVLAMGGSRPPMEIFHTFRSRAPNTAALLRHAGLQER